jgi:hypothetical protein
MKSFSMLVSFLGLTFGDLPQRKKSVLSAHISLDDFAKSEPTWEQLEAMANDIMMRNGNRKQFGRSKLRPDAK